MFIVNRSKKYSMVTLFSVLMIVALLSIMFSISYGSTHFSLAQLGQSLFKTTDSIQYDIVFKLRLPRTCCAFITGGLLALAGALMQILLRNPLADPYVLGVSGGAAVAILIAMLLGVATHYLSGIAFAGSLFSMLIVMKLAKIRYVETPHLLLMGVVVAAGWGAIISFILTVSPQQDLHNMLFWLMGDLSYSHFSFWQILVLIIGLLVSFVLAKPLNVLCRGNLIAQALGVNTSRMNFILYVVSSLLTACAVSMAGCISFVGLIVPHMLRLLGKTDHRFVLPASVLLGGSLLTLADTLSRTLMAPIQLPVGVVTAIIGVPTFLFLLRCNYR